MIFQTSQHIPKHNYRTYKLNLDKKIKDMYIEVEMIKLSLFAGDGSVYIDNPKEFFKKFLEGDGFHRVAD